MNTTRKRMPLVYVAGPYRASNGWGVHQNIQRAEAVALDLWKMGYSVICPHKNTGYFDGACPDHVWLDGDFEMIRRCDAIVMISGWLDSAGAQEELDCAIEHDLAVFYYPMDVDKLIEYQDINQP